MQGPGDATPLLEVRELVKSYFKGRIRRHETFRLEANFRIDGPSVVGVMGPNGSGKTTLFELITGSNSPSSGEVRCAGRNIHRVKYRERDRLAIHYHQSYQVRSFRRTVPSFLLEPARSEYPLVHLFDEPQFNAQDGYIGFMLEFFARLRGEGRLVFLCVHPNEPYHLQIMREICERYIFVSRGNPLLIADTFDDLVECETVRSYLGNLLTRESA